MLSLGDRVIVRRRELDLLKGVCVGMTGTISRINEWNNKTWHEIRATNRGLLMRTASGGEGKIYAWQEGNKASFLEGELEKLQ